VDDFIIVDCECIQDICGLYGTPYCNGKTYVRKVNGTNSYVLNIKHFLILKDEVLDD